MKLTEEGPVRREFFQILKDLAIPFFGTYSVFIAILTLAQIFNAQSITTPIAGMGAWGFYLVGLHSLALSSIIAIARLFLRWKRAGIDTDGADDNDSGRRLSGELYSIVKKSYDAKNYIDVIRFGALLSRPLWLAQRLKERVAIGEMVEDAAARNGDIEKQVTALIDDIGWSNAVLGDDNKAEKSIVSGITKAAGNNFWYLAAKGERHLAAICIRKRDDHTAAQQHLDESKKYAEQIPEPYHKAEFLASLHFAKAELDLSAKRYDEALTSAKHSKADYEAMGRQEERIVKIQSILGRAYIGLHQPQQAFDAFREGLILAEKFPRNDEKAANLMGLADLYFAENNYKKAAKHYADAAKIYEDSELRHDAARALAGKERSEQELKQLTKLRKDGRR